MITKELLSEVLSCRVDFICESMSNDFVEFYLEFSDNVLIINIYELVHKHLKQFVIEKGCDIQLIPWEKEPKEIIQRVQDMMDEAKADEDWEAQNGNV